MGLSGQAASVFAGRRRGEASRAGYDVKPTGPGGGSAWRGRKGDPTGASVTEGEMAVLGKAIQNQSIRSRKLSLSPWKTPAAIRDKRPPRTAASMPPGWLVKGLCQATAGARKGSRGRNNACRMVGTWQVPGACLPPAQPCQTSVVCVCVVGVGAGALVNLGTLEGSRVWSWFPELIFRAQCYAYHSQPGR